MVQIVRCNVCGRWIGEDDKLGIEIVNGCEVEYCPVCYNTGGLMDVDSGSSFTDMELKRLWEMFGNIPVGDNDEIQEEFLGFSKGTDRIDIWHWFDERHSKGVAYMVYGEDSQMAVGSVGIS